MTTLCLYRGAYLLYLWTNPVLFVLWPLRDELYRNIWTLSGLPYFLGAGLRPGQLSGEGGIEPPTRSLELTILPLNYSPYWLLLSSPAPHLR
jgi:hypothetical protein